jgi:hypothetical protein
VRVKTTLTVDSINQRRKNNFVAIRTEINSYRYNNLNNINKKIIKCVAKVFKQLITY